MSSPIGPNPNISSAPSNLEGTKQKYSISSKSTKATVDLTTTDEKSAKIKPQSLPVVSGPLQKSVGRMKEGKTSSPVTDVKNTAQEMAQAQADQSEAARAREESLVTDLFHKLTSGELDLGLKYDREGELKISKKNPELKALGLSHTYRVVKIGEKEGSDIHTVYKCMGRIGEGANKKARKWTPIDKSDTPDKVTGKYKNLDIESNPEFLSMLEALELLKHHPRLPNMDPGEIHKIGNQYYLVTEYADGGSVADQIKKGDLAKNSDLLLKWAFQLSGAVSMLHRAGIGHRDIKPDNIFINNGNIVLSDFDFAICKHCPCETQAASPMYQPPEFFRPWAVITLKDIQKSDNYTLGVSLYEMKFEINPQVNGVLPDTADRRAIFNLDDFKKSWIAEHGELPDSTPMTLEYIIYSLMNPSPEKRMTSAQAFDEISKLYNPSQ